jgi:hypothetical protein
VGSIYVRNGKYYIHNVASLGFTGKLGVVGYQGSSAVTGDEVTFNGVALRYPHFPLLLIVLSNAQAPADNFFQSTRETLGVPVSVTGDLPQLTGSANSMSGIDMHIVDVTANLVGNMQTCNIVVSSSSDTVTVSSLIFSVTSYERK